LVISLINFFYYSCATDVMLFWVNVVIVQHVSVRLELEASTPVS